MSGYENITDKVNGYTRRLKKLHPADFATFGTQGDGWFVRAVFCNVVGRGPLPFDALAAFEIELSRLEEVDKNMAQTLGVSQ